MSAPTTAPAGPGPVLRPDGRRVVLVGLTAGSGGPVGFTTKGGTATADGTGCPSFRWGLAPAGIATRRQLAAWGLAPTGEPVARLVWAAGRRWADLYPVTTARLKNTPTPQQLAALGAAMRARRTCPVCGRLAPYVISTALGACLDCHEHTHTTTATPGPDEDAGPVAA